jgi:RHS repeat-associated protein
VAGARQGLWTMRHRPEDAFKCGPLGLHQVLLVAKAGYTGDPRVLDFPSTPQGTSLAAMHALARDVGFPMIMAKRVDPAAAPVVPALLHWRADHFAALVRAEGGRFVIRDMTFGGESWVSRAALDQEASGYVLVPAGPLPAGWTAVDAAEGSRVVGKGINTANDAERTDPCCGTAGGNAGGGGAPAPGESCPTCGLATYRFHLMVVSLNILDTPVWYTPPRGPAPRFTVTYSQREGFQPQTFAYSNLGPKWTFDWLSYVEDDPTNGSAPAGLYQRGGGHQTHTGFSAGTQSYAPYKRDQAILVRTATAPVQYERRLKDGSVEVFGQPDGASTYPRRVFLTAWKDAQGNTVTFTYDASFRIVAATDALGQVTTVSYQHADPLKVTKVTDPFGRFATFSYDTAGRLTQITDMGGLASTLTYGPGDFITSLTTPYGTTRFQASELGLDRSLEAIDPLGGRERVDYLAGPSYSDPPATVPVGMATWNQYLGKSNTFFWSKRAMATAPGDKAQAHVYHWAEITGGVYASGTLESEKAPLEGRIWYNYPGQSGSNYEGTGIDPTATGRVLDDGTSQVSKAEYNSRGLVTKRIDPLGREMQYSYAANGLDLTEVRQKVGGSADMLYSATYNNQHRPLTVTDAAGETTTFTYNAAGQVLTVTNAKSETTTYAYDTNGYLQSVTGPVWGATTSYTYDGYGRVRTVTDSDGATQTLDYDGLDRVTRTTYPDTTYEETVYDRLDPVQQRDRLGLWSRTTYDALRRPTATRDPQGRTITQQWCPCGSLDALVDAKGQAARWTRDIQGRVTQEHRASGPATQYTYETRTSRLKTVTDQKGQLTTYSYFLDDRLQQLAFTNEQIETPNVSYTFETAYPRVATMVDGTGTTSYSYVPAGTLGAGQVATVDGPLTNDVIAYTYDELGRVEERTINGSANELTYVYDALGRVTSETNVLGTFVYGYDGVSGRLSTVTYPNGQTSAYSYLPTAQDHQLETIHHKYPGGATLSKFNYTYDTVGNIQTWRQQADSDPAVEWQYDYDRVGQLLSAIKQTTDPTPTALTRYGYAYDLAGNRTAEQIDGVVTGASYNSLNQLVSQQPGGALRFAGTLNEPATVTVAGTAVSVTPDNRFEGPATVTSGTSVVTVTAQDGSGNLRTNQYEVSQSGASKTFTYDANGNLISDGSRTFEWDARNELVAVNVGTHRSEFTYDGEQRRVRLIEKENGVTQSDARVLWCETEICEERAADGITIARRRFSLGEQTNGQARLFTSDHIGSVREVNDNVGTLLGRYAFDPWGRRTVTAGSDPTTVGFTGHLTHLASSLSLTLYRAYDADFGRWLSTDPLGDVDGPNRYLYVLNRPIETVDLFGDQALPRPGPVPRGGGVGVPGMPSVRVMVDLDVRESPYPRDKPKECDSWRQRWGCLASAHLTPTTAHPNRNQVGFIVYALGYGQTQPEAEEAARRNVQHAVPSHWTKTWWYVRHVNKIRIVKCWRQ